MRLSIHALDDDGEVGPSEFTQHNTHLVVPNPPVSVAVTGSLPGYASVSLGPRKRLGFSSGNGGVQN